MVLLSLSWVRISLSWPHGLGKWPHGVVILIMGEAGLSNFFTLASWIRKLTFLSTPIFFFFCLKYLKSPKQHDFFLLFCQKYPALFYAKNRTKLSLKLPISQCFFTFQTF